MNANYSIGFTKLIAQAIYATQPFCKQAIAEQRGIGGITPAMKQRMAA